MGKVKIRKRYAMHVAAENLKRETAGKKHAEEVTGTVVSELAIDSKEATEDADKAAALSRGQKKRLARKAIRLRRLGLSTEAATEKLRQALQSAKTAHTAKDTTPLVDMDAFKKVLNSVDFADLDMGAAGGHSDTATGAAAHVPTLKHGKTRTRVMVEETKHMTKVMEHPAFVSNPLAALQQHLRATVSKGKK